MVEPQTHQPLIRNFYGGFWRRFLAWLIDQLILVPVVVVCSLVAAFATAVVVRVSDPHVSPSVAGYKVGEAVTLAFPVGYLVVAWLYFAFLESSSKQSTYGKRLLRLVVTDEAESRISFARASGRFWGKLLSGVLLIGFIVAAFTQKKQAFHDKLAGTLVLRRSASQLSNQSRQSPRQLFEQATAIPASPVAVQPPLLGSTSKLLAITAQELQARNEWNRKVLQAFEEQRRNELEAREEQKRKELQAGEEQKRKELQAREEQKRKELQAREEQNQAREEQKRKELQAREEQKRIEAVTAEERARELHSDREAAFARAQHECPLPVQKDGQLPGGLRLLNDEFLVTVGKDWLGNLSSQRLAVTTHRVIYTHGRINSSAGVVYLTDIRDVRSEKQWISGWGPLILETAGGHSIEGLPASPDVAAIRDTLLTMVHYARQRATTPPPTTAVAQPAPPQDKYGQLKQLAELKEQGVITPQEFDAEKAKLLGGP